MGHAGAIDDRGYSFVSSTYKAILIEEKNLHMISIDLEKAYDKVSRDVLWWTLMKKRVPIKYIDIIKNMYDEVVTNVRTCGGIINVFLSQLDCIKDVYRVHSYLP